MRYGKRSISVALMLVSAAACLGMIYHSDFSNVLEDETRLPSPGGAWTRVNQPANSLVAPPAHLDSEAKLAFFTGFSFFRSPWVSAPASTTARDGLGPLFNAHSCEGCHPNGGRGKSLLDSPSTAATVIKLSVLMDERFIPHPIYGEQVQTKSTYFGGAEAKVSMTSKPVTVTLTESENWELRQPITHVDWVPNEWPQTDVYMSTRVAPPLIGLGLLEEISESTLLSKADPEDSDGDGISGRVHWLTRADGQKMMGRFGWKAERIDIREQVGAAFSQDLGITNPAFSESACTGAQVRCLQQQNGNDEQGYEIPDQLFRYINFFVRSIPPPKAGKLTPKVMNGQATFRRIGCAACHTPSYETTAGKIWPFTDLLLHDLGAPLADNHPHGDAMGSEWRTPPLWGTGTMKKVAGHTTLLHDGRARNVTEAILWHHGEANSARLQFQALARSEQKALVAYINAL